MMGLPDGWKSFQIGLAVLLQYWRVTDTHPASQPHRRSKYALCISASCTVKIVLLLTNINLIRVWWTVSYFVQSRQREVQLHSEGSPTNVRVYSVLLLGLHIYRVDIGPFDQQCWRQKCAAQAHLCSILISVSFLYNEFILCD